MLRATRGIMCAAASPDGRVGAHMERVIDFNCAGLSRLLASWIRSGMQQDPSEMAGEMVECLSPELIEAGRAAARADERGHEREHVEQHTSTI